MLLRGLSTVTAKLCRISMLQKALMYEKVNRKEVDAEWKDFGLVAVSCI